MYFRYSGQDSEMKKELNIVCLPTLTLGCLWQVKLCIMGLSTFTLEDCSYVEFLGLCVQDTIKSET